MRNFAISLSAGIVALSIAAAAHAAPGIAILAWNGCNTSPITNLAVAAGQSSGVHLTCFVTGQSDPTLGYQVQILYGDANHAVPDAWRFDAAGCQGSGFVVLNHLAPSSLSTSCPSFQNAGGARTSLQIKDLNFSPPSLPYPLTMMRIVVANVFATGNAPVAAAKYFLCDAEFDHTFSVVGPTPSDHSACGGLEDGICFHLVSATYLLDSPAQPEVPFQIGSGAFVSANAPGGSCLVDAAHPTTWGAIKGQYRN